MLLAMACGGAIVKVTQVSGPTAPPPRGVKVPGKTRCRCAAARNESNITLWDSGEKDGSISSPVLGELSRRQLIQWCLVVGTAPQTWASQADALPPTVLRRMNANEIKAVDQVMKEVVPMTKAPLMLRLVFHDGATYRQSSGDGGLNGSIRFETDRPENFGLKRGVNVIYQMQQKLKGTDAEDLSFADCVALAGAYAVKITNGPEIEVPVGRRDAAQADPIDRMPEESLSSVQQIEVFKAMGFKPIEMVALLGSHTVWILSVYEFFALRM